MIAWHAGHPDGTDDAAPPPTRPARPSTTDPNTAPCVPGCLPPSCPARRVPQIINGIRCGQPMYPSQRLDLGHTDDRTGYIGLVHHACNIRAAAIKANQTRQPARSGPPLMVTSRRW